MNAIGLPNLPKDKEFEEYVCALFQCLGYYTERRLIDRQIEEVLELDVIATDYRTTAPTMSLVEAKSGDWGFSDIFKVKGWLEYTGLPKGMLAVSKDRGNAEFVKEIGRHIGVSTAVIGDLDSARDIICSITGDTGTVTKADMAIWRFSYWVERNLLARIVHKKKSETTKKCYRAMNEYFHEVNNGTFFTQSVPMKVWNLYDAFQKYPKFSAKCSHEMKGEDFDGLHDEVEKSVFRDTYYLCKYNDIQLSTYVEHRARLAILKSAVDYLLYRDSGMSDKTNSHVVLFGTEIDLMEALPESFREGLVRISKHTSYRLYPKFWQWFMWAFGGFILTDFEEQEFKLLSDKTGVPIQDIPDALSAYQILFPQASGWLANQSPHSHVKILKLFPVPFMGIGANYRRLLYSPKKSFGDLKVSGAHTLDNMAEWNNLTYEVLGTK